MTASGEDRTLAHRQHATHTLRAAHAVEAAEINAREMARLDDGTRTYKEARSAAGKAVSRALRAQYPDEWRAAIDAYTKERGEKVEGPPYAPLDKHTRELMLTVCEIEISYQLVNPKALVAETDEFDLEPMRRIGEALGLLERVPHERRPGRDPRPNSRSAYRCSYVGGF